MVASYGGQSRERSEFAASLPAIVRMNRYVHVALRLVDCHFVSPEARKHMCINHANGSSLTA